jgi:iron complex outermembrane receptor protein
VTYTGVDFDSGEEFPYALRRSYELTGEWANFINPTDKLSLLFGGTENHDNGRNYSTATDPFRRDSHGDRDSKGLYAQAEYAPLDKLKLIGGLQANKVDGVNLSVDPRADAIYALTTDLNMKLDYGQAFRAPSINELYLGSPGLHGNPNLKPETVKTTDVSLNYAHGPLGATLHYFYSTQYNLIYQERPANIYENLGTIESRGAGLDGKYNLSKQLLLTGSALYQTSQDQTGTSAVAPIATFGIKGGVSYKADRGVTLSVFDIYQGPLASKYETTVNPSPGAYNILSLNSRFDMYKLTGWEITRHLTLLFRVDNLFNQVVWLPNWGLLPGSSLPVDQGRILYSGIEVSF